MSTNQIIILRTQAGGSGNWTVRQPG